MSAEEGWIEDEPEDEGPDLGALGCGQPETVADTMRLQAEAMMEEGYSVLAVIAGMQQIAAELTWEVCEEIGGAE